MKTARKLLSGLVILCMVLTFVPMAFAQDSTETAGAYANADHPNEKTTVDGNVTVTNGYAAAQAYAEEGGNASVTVTGNASNTASGDYADGASAVAEGANSQAAVTVGGNVTATANVSNDYANASGATANSEDGGSAELSVGGDVTATAKAGETASSFGVYAQSYGDGNAEATVQGDVTATADGKSGNAYAISAYNADVSVAGEVSAESKGGTGETDGSTACGVTAQADINNVAVTVGGNVSATSTGGSADQWPEARGVYAFANNTQEVSVSVSGDVSASSENGNAYGAMASSMTKNNPDGGTVSVTVAGTVTAESEAGDAIGLDAWATKGEGGKDGSVTVEAQGVVATAGDGGLVTGVNVGANSIGTEVTAKIGVDGITATGGKEACGVGVMSAGGTACLEVAGDVTADDFGIALALVAGGLQGDDIKDAAKVDVLVEGTVKGGKAAVELLEPTVTDNLTLTVWKAELNDDGKVVSGADFSVRKEQDKENPEMIARLEEAEKKTAEVAEQLEAKILYIIKLEQPGAEQGSVTLAGVVDSHGFDAAREGDTVTLKSLVKEGYKLVGAFNGTDNKTSLMKDANGDYYIVVPKGGGVFLTVKMEKVEAPADNSSSGNADVNNYVPAPAPAPTGKVTVETNAVEATQGYDVDVSDSENSAELKSALLTKEEQQDVAQGKDVSIAVEYKPATVSDADQKQVQEAVGSAKIATWLNVSVFKQVGDAGKVQVEKPSGKITLQIVAPDDIIALAKSGTPFEVVSIVNGKVVRIPAVYNEKTGTIDFETDFFGVFALVYGK